MKKLQLNDFISLLLQKQLEVGVEYLLLDEKYNVFGMIVINNPDYDFSSIVSMVEEVKGKKGKK